MNEDDYSDSIGFSIKAKDTLENKKVHDEFKEFCKYNTKDDRTIGLSLLLNHFNNYNKLLEFEERLRVLESEVFSKDEYDEEDIDKQVI